MRYEEEKAYFCISDNNMLAELHRFITDHCLIGHAERVLLAVSGGIDSMVMANLFLHLPYDTGIAHCNFSLRGPESDQDEEFVKNFSSYNKLPFFPARFDTKSVAREKGISVQMAARELRYNWFEEVRKNNNYDRIAVAHNLNDNLETMIINLVRGTGLAGLAGMRPSSGKVIRPLLFASREEISHYANTHSIIYREDKSNAETKYTRNKIRHKVIPLLQEINPSLLVTLSRESERFHELDEIVANYIQELRNDLSYQTENETVFFTDKLKEYSTNRTVLFELFRHFGINSMQLNDLVNIIGGRSGSQVITPTHRIFKNRNELLVISRTNVPDSHFTINSPEEFPSAFSAEIVEKNDAFMIPSDPATGCMDADKVVFPLVLRRWNPGDFFYPLGMKGRKKLSDYFIDRKYPFAEKEKKTVLESGGKIAWIVADRIDDRFKVTNETRRVMIVKRLDSPSQPIDSPVGK